MPLIIGIEKGWFKEESLEIEMTGQLLPTI